MSIRVTWANEQETLLAWTFDQDWTADTYSASHRQLARLIQSKDYPVDIIIDLRECTHIPHKLLVLVRQSTTSHSDRIHEIKMLTASGYWHCTMTCQHTLRSRAWQFQPYADDDKGIKEAELDSSSLHINSMVPNKVSLVVE